jgi:hypothetical protein
MTIAKSHRQVQRKTRIMSFNPYRCIAQRAALVVISALAVSTSPARSEDVAKSPVSTKIRTKNQEKANREKPEQDEKPPTVAEVLKAIEEAAPDHPEWKEMAAQELKKPESERAEWVDMLMDIVGGSHLGPTDGWFRRAVAQTRYGWEDVAQKYDKDGDGEIARCEYPGTDIDFARLDRNHSDALDEADFDFSPHSLAPTPGLALFMRADRNGDGRLTLDELTAFYKRCDRDDQGFLSLMDVQEAFLPGKPLKGSSGGPDGPKQDTLIRGLFRQEIGSLQPGPALGAPAPDFTLKTVDGSKELTLSKLIGPKPVVLIFGNVTCGPFRSHGGNIEKLSRRYRDRANFAMVYVREAHPSDGWAMESNDRVGVTLEQPKDYAGRVKSAELCTSRLKLEIPVLVDTIDDAIGSRYSGMPGRFYVIDSHGRIAYKSGRGPFGFKPAELEQSLILLLEDESTKSTSKTSAAAR